MKDSKSGKKSENKDEDDRYSWRRYCGAGYFYNVYPENYKTYDDYELALMREIHARGDEDKFARSSSGNAARNAGSYNQVKVPQHCIAVRSARKTRQPGRKEAEDSKEQDSFSFCFFLKLDGYAEPVYLLTRDSSVKTGESIGILGLVENSTVCGAVGRRQARMKIPVPFPKNGILVINACRNEFEWVQSPFEFKETAEEVTLKRYDRREGFTEVEIPEFVDGKPVRLIADQAFVWQSDLERIKIPEEVREIGIGAFRRCTKLREIVLPSSLKNIGASAFQGCEALREIRIPEGVSGIQRYTFEGCTALRWIYLPDSVVDIEANNFSGKYASKEVTIYCHAGSYAWEYAERNHILHEEPGEM